MNTPAGNTANSPTRFTRVDAVIVAVLLVGGLALRIPGLNAGLWYDEILALINVVRLPAAEIVGRFETLNNHVLYSLAAHFTVEWFGESARALRLPALVFGIASLPALYLLGRQITDRREALLAAVLMTLSYHHVWFSQNARGYTALALGTVLASILFIAMLKSGRSSRVLVLAYAITAALTTWVHMTAVFVVAAHGLVLLWLAARHARIEPRAGLAPPAVAILLSGAIAFALYIPVLPDVLAALAGRIGPPDVESRWYEWSWVFMELVRGAERALPGGAVLAVAAIVALAAGTVSYLRQDAALAGVLLLPGLLAAAAFAAFSYVFFPRFVFFALPLMLLIAVRGGFTLAAFVLPFLSRNHVLIVGLLLAAATATAVPGAWLPKQDFAAAARFVDERRSADDAVVCPDIAYRALAVHLGLDCTGVANVAELERLEVSSGKTWLVYTLPISLEAKLPDVRERVRSHYTEVARFRGTLGGGDVVVVSNRRAGAAGN
ncbi:MAG: glycosyltransferase family 39 protein [Gammaproteobacteria bacterium]|nr:glycosyltransferase family 39 protein [Gammaproteobacteria bacterium]